MAKPDHIQRAVSEVSSEKKESDLNKNDFGSEISAARLWTPGVARRFPWLSLVALLIVLASCGGLIVILYKSDGKNSDTWCSSTYNYHIKTINGYESGTRTLTITVNVWIAIVAFVAGKAMAFAFAEAVTTAWWVRALQEGTTFEQLHHNWESGRSVSGVLKSPKMFNLICLASVAFTCFAGLGAVFQKATAVVTGTESTSPNLSAYVAVNFPAGWSGSVGNEVYPDINPSPALSALKSDYNKNTGLVLDVDLCGSDSKVTCNMLLPAVGFRYDCEAGEIEFEGYDANAPLISTVSPNPDIQTFGVSILSDANSWTASLNVTFKTNPNCLQSTIQYRNCTLTPALVNYNITVSEKIPILNPPTASPYWSNQTVRDVLVDSVNQTLAYPLPADYENQMRGVPRTVSSLYDALGSIFDMSATYNKGDVNGSRYKEVGPYTSTYHNSTPSGGDINGNIDECNYTWNDPLPDVTLQIRQFMFRTALELAQKNVSAVHSHTANFTPYETYTQSQAFESVVKRIIPVYQTNYRFIWIGMGLMLTVVATTLVLFYGYWRLGRKFSLSPLEMAKAMSAGAGARSYTAAGAVGGGLAVADDADDVIGGSNAEMKDLLRYFGHRKIKYGEVTSQVLGFSFREGVEMPRGGQLYL